MQFFGGGFCVPVFTNILLNQLVPSLRPLANSFANVVYNLLGFMMGPLVYGLLSLGFKPEDSSPMLITQCLSIFSVFFLGLGYIIRTQIDRVIAHKYDLDLGDRSIGYYEVK